MGERTTVGWRRLDWPGHEVAELVQVETGWRLHGVVVVEADAGRSALEYDIAIDPSWRSRSCRITTLLGAQSPPLELARSADGGWIVNGEPRADLDGCVDVDLAFSPSTNLLPIRRLALEVGAEAAVRAAWVRFPELRIEVLEQTYRRTAPRGYRYESADGAFQRELVVDDLGFVVEYPGLWAAAT